MPPLVALGVLVALVLWLFAVNRKSHGGGPSGLWIPLVWLLVIGSKPPASWVAVITRTPAPTEGNIADTLLFSSLLLAALVVLRRKNLDWRAIFSDNKWIFLYFAYEGCSVLWSDHGLDSLKLWVKDCGNLLMVLLILSEENPVGAVKSVLLGTAYVLIPLSVVLVKYFPDIGKVYNGWTYQPRIIGVSTDKNMLGKTLMISAVAIFWSYSELRKRLSAEKIVVWGDFLVIVMTLWLLIGAHSATSLACTILGTGILLGMTRPFVRDSVQRLGLGGFILLAAVAICLASVFNLSEVFTGLLDRDLTFTGRTTIWQRSLLADVDPIIGAGYADFWTGERTAKISEGIGFFYRLREAHNGYLDVYLNCGIIGVFLLLCAIGSGASRILRGLADVGSWGVFRFTFLLVALVYNLSESAFGALDIVWFAFLLAIVEYPHREVGETDSEHEPSSETLVESQAELYRVGTPDFAAAAEPCYQQGLRFQDQL